MDRKGAQTEVCATLKRSPTDAVRRARLQTMELTLHIPDEVAQRLAAAGGDLSRRALEAFSLEEYRAGRLTEAQLRQLLGLETRDALDGFLKAHEVWLNYSLDDLERERAALRRLSFGG